LADFDEATVTVVGFVTCFEANQTVSERVVGTQNSLNFKRCIGFDPSNEIDLFGN